MCLWAHRLTPRTLSARDTILGRWLKPEPQAVLLNENFYTKLPSWPIHELLLRSSRGVPRVVLTTAPMSERHPICSQRVSSRKCGRSISTPDRPGTQNPDAKYHPDCRSDAWTTIAEHAIIRVAGSLEPLPAYFVDNVREQRWRRAGEHLDGVRVMPNSMPNGSPRQRG
jgi:hypothetical protein